MSPDVFICSPPFAVLLHEVVELACSLVSHLCRAFPTLGAMNSNVFYSEASLAKDIVVRTMEGGKE